MLNNIRVIYLRKQLAQLLTATLENTMTATPTGGYHPPMTDPAPEPVSLEKPAPVDVPQYPPPTGYPADVAPQMTLPPGWYRDTGRPGGRGYWDGYGWTDAWQNDPDERQRAEILNTAVMGAVANGGRVEAHTSTQAIVVFGTPCNHVLHAILTFFTCLFWAPIWIILAIVQKEHRTVITVDHFGQVTSAAF